jgi:hypothetical protein
MEAKDGQIKNRQKQLQDVHRIMIRSVEADIRLKHFCTGFITAQLEQCTVQEDKFLTIHALK